MQEDAIFGQFIVKIRMYMGGSNGASNPRTMEPPSSFVRRKEERKGGKEEKKEEENKMSLSLISWLAPLLHAWRWRARCP